MASKKKTHPENFEVRIFRGITILRIFGKENERQPFPPSFSNCLEYGIHPLIKIIIQTFELYHLSPKLTVSKLRDLEYIKQKYIFDKKQITSFNNNRRKKLIDDYLKNVKDSLMKFVEDNYWNKAERE